MNTKSTVRTNENPTVIYFVGAFHNEYVIYRIFTTRELAEAYRVKHSDWHLSIKEEQLYNSAPPEDS